MLSGDIVNTAQISDAYANVCLVTDDRRPLPPLDKEDITSTKGPLPAIMNKNGQFTFSLKVEPFEV
jgi:hypothetical protein